MVNLSADAKNAACSAVVTLAQNGGKLQLLTSENVLVAEFIWSGAVFGSVSNGEATANPVNSTSAVADGTVTQWKMLYYTGSAYSDLMWGVVGQRYKIVSYDLVNNTITLGGDKSSIFTARTEITLVNTSNPADNLICHVDDEGPTYNGTNTVIPIFEDLVSPFNYSFAHIGLLGLDNVDVKETQTVQLSSFKYRILG